MAGLAAYALVSAAPNILVVNMGKVYQNFYKAKNTMAQIESSANQTRQELAKMAAQRDEIVKQLAPIQEKMRNAALSDEAKRKIYETEAQPKIAEATAIENRMKEMQQNASQHLQKNIANTRQVQIQEIVEVLKKLAADKKADFVLDHTAAPFYKPEADITDELIKAVNKNAPASFKK